MYPCDCEAKAKAKLRRHAKKMANEFYYFWHLGDGEGGYILEVLMEEFEQASRERTDLYADQGKE